MAPEPTTHESLLADTRWLHRLLESLVGDSHAAEDLHQEALLAAWTHGSTGNVTRSWLSRVAKNLAASFHRRANRRTRAEGSQSINKPSSAPPELIVEAELQGRAVEAVLALDEPYRTTVLLRYMKGRSLDETALEMAVPVDTVRTRQRRALEFLRERLGVRARRRAWLPVAWLAWAKVIAVMMISKKSAISAISVLALLAIGWHVVPLTVESPAVAPNQELSLDPLALAVEQGSQDEELLANRTVLETQPADPVTEPDLHRILVTRKETGEPIPNAEVTYYAMSESLRNKMSREEMQEMQDLIADWEKLTRRHGSATVTNEDGIAFIPNGDDDRFVYAASRHGTLYGQLAFDMKSREDQEAGHLWHLELERDLAIDVQVLDSLGQPAIDVPLGIHPRGVARFPFEVDQYFYRDLVRTEAPNGTARISHLQLLNRDRQQKGIASADYVLHARIPGLIEDGPIFDSDQPPTEPVLLRLPPTGSIIVATRDSEGGSLLPSSGTLTLSMAPKEVSVDLDDYQAMPDQWWPQPTTDDGVTVFDRAVVGESYLVFAYLGGERIHKVVEGPTRVHEEIRVTIGPKARSFNLVGRVLNAGRAPLINDKFLAIYHGADGSRQGRDLLTDHEGRFKVMVGSQDHGMTLEDLSVMIETHGHPSLRSSAMYHMQGTMPLHLGNNDLGDLVLGESPLVVAGRVLVDGETPKRTQFNLQVETLSEQAISGTTTENWRPVGGVVLTFSEHGHFEIRGPLKPSRYRINMSWNTDLGNGGRMDYLPLEPMEFALGTNDLRVDLQSGGSLQAVVLMDDIAKLDNLWLRLIRTDNAQSGEVLDAASKAMANWEKRLQAQYEGQTDGQHRYRWGAVSPGIYRLEILPRGAQKAVATIEGIQINAGENDQDSRLDGIDLRGKIRAIEIMFQDAMGQRISTLEFDWPVVLIDDGRTDTEIYCYNAINGRVTIITGEPYLDLLVVARDYLPARLRDVRDDRVVVLHPFPKIQLKFTGGLKALPEGHSLLISLSKKGQARDERMLFPDYAMDESLESWLQPSSKVMAIDKKGEATIQVAGEGRYSIAVTLSNDTSQRFSPIELFEPTEIVVPASDATRTFEFQISEENLKLAEQRAAKR